MFNLIFSFFIVPFATRPLSCELFTISSGRKPTRFFVSRAISVTIIREGASVKIHGEIYEIVAWRENFYTWSPSRWQNETSRYVSARIFRNFPAGPVDRES